MLFSSSVGSAKMRTGLPLLCQGRGGGAGFGIEQIAHGAAGEIGQFLLVRDLVGEDPAAACPPFRQSSPKTSCPPGRRDRAAPASAGRPCPWRGSASCPCHSCPGSRPKAGDTTCRNRPAGRHRASAPKYSAPAPAAARSTAPRPTQGALSAGDLAFKRRVEHGRRTGADLRDVETGDGGRDQSDQRQHREAAADAGIVFQRLDASASRRGGAARCFWAR